MISDDTWLPAAAAECHTATDAYTAAARAEHAARQHRDLIGDISSYQKHERAALRGEIAAKTACLTRFTESRGLKPGKPTCGTDSLFRAAELRCRRIVGDPPDNVVDHAIELKAGRRVVGILSHTYAPVRAIEAYADAHGLIHEILPASWYSPLTTAVLFTRRDQ